MIKDFSKEFGGINFIDLGCSGGLDKRWAPFGDYINFTGFDPRQEACDELTQKEWPYLSARFLPYAISGEDGEVPLYLTKSPHCTSLREPNNIWLDRFLFHDLFNVETVEKIECVTLDTLTKTENLHADMMKMDIQGMEGPVLETSNTLFEELIVLEIESGFTRNYLQESVFWEINQMMEDRGFIMYEIFLNRMGRNNSQGEKGKIQPLWCQSIWLRDFVGNKEVPSLRTATLTIQIASMMEYYDYAKEMQDYFIKCGVLENALIDFDNMSSLN